MRTKFSEALKAAMKEKDKMRTETVRMILSALKNKDVEARTMGKGQEIDDPAIASMLQGMIKQRHESAALYEQGGRQELADKERAEIKVIESFLPKQMTEDELRAVVTRYVAENVAEKNGKAMGQVMKFLKEQFAGQYDGGKANAIVKEALAS